MNIKHLRGNLYAIKGKKITLADGSPGITANSIFIDDTKKAIIDPASDGEVLKAIGRDHKIDYCFLTHAHYDHICSLQYFPDSEIFIHEDEDTSRDAIFYNSLYTRHLLLGLMELTEHHLFNFRPTHLFIDMAVFEIGSTKLQVIHMPGHTKGHCFFYFPNEKILYSSDFDLSALGPTYPYSDSSIDDMIQSAEKIKEFPADIWVTGHWRFIVQDGFSEKIALFINQIEERDNRLLDFLKAPKRRSSILGKGLILPQTVIQNSRLMKSMERRMINKHLERLLLQGKVERKIFDRWVTL